MNDGTYEYEHEHERNVRCMRTTPRSFIYAYAQHSHSSVMKFNIFLESRRRLLLLRRFTLFLRVILTLSDEEIYQIPGAAREC